MYDERDILGNEILKGDIVLSVSRDYGYIPIYIAISGINGDYTCVGSLSGDTESHVGYSHNTASRRIRNLAPIKADVYFRNNPKKLQLVKDVVEKFIKTKL